MICEKCQKLALYPRPHQCVNCARFCDFKEMRFCNYCSITKSICQVCARPIVIERIISDKPKEQPKTAAERIHPFFGEQRKGGCRSCGG
jgi:hypothetical protein